MVSTQNDEEAKKFRPPGAGQVGAGEHSAAQDSEGGAKHGRAGQLRIQGKA